MVAIGRTRDVRCGHVLGGEGSGSGWGGERRRGAERRRDALVEDLQRQVREHQEQQQELERLERKRKRRERARASRAA